MLVLIVFLVIVISVEYKNMIKYINEALNEKQKRRHLEELHRAKLFQLSVKELNKQIEGYKEDK